MRYEFAKFDMKENNRTPIEYAILAADTMMEKYIASQLPPVGRFHYHQGVFLSGLERTYFSTGEEKYFEYIKSWVDSIIMVDGTITNQNEEQLDDFQPGNLLFYLFERTGREHYKKVLDGLIEKLKAWPVNAYGGFWHMKNLKDQMWLDGIYMAGPLLLKYGLKYQDEKCVDLVYMQLKLMREHMTDAKTGLLYHAWNSGKECMWADRKSGCSSEFWGRAIGWYCVTAVDLTEMLPVGHPYKTYFAEAAKDILAALAVYQDKELGLWFQVVNKGDKRDNWPEMSCSALFTYAFSKAVRIGVLTDEYEQVAHTGYKGVIEGTEFTFRGEFTVPRVCIGTGIGDYGFYVKRSAVVNDLHGMGAFLLMCNEYNLLVMSRG